MRTDEQTIRDLIANWARATAVGDLPQILSAMAEDAVFLSAGNPPMRGRDAFASSFESMANKVHVEAASDIQEIQVSGDMAYAWAFLTITITPKNGGSPERRTGYALSIFRKVDGTWLLSRDANMLGMLGPASIPDSPSLQS